MEIDPGQIMTHDDGDGDAVAVISLPSCFISKHTQIYRIMNIC